MSCLIILSLDFAVKSNFGLVVTQTLADFREPRSGLVWKAHLKIISPNLSVMGMDTFH